ncbi:MAG: FecR family protein, partial [Polyangiales bacterium]
MERERAERLRRAMDPPWDDLREQRILSRVLAETSGDAARPAPRNLRPLWLLLAAAAVVLLGVFAIPRLRSTPVALHAPTTPSVAEPTKLTLVDGSVASLRADAQVRVDEQSTKNVELTQIGGQVHYDVTHDVTRPFRVHVGNVIVSVHGTRFFVTATGDNVEVRVEQGVVGVDDGAREREVTAGETLIVPARLGVAPNPPPKPAGSESTGPAAGTATAAKTATTNVDPPVTAAVLLARADDARAKGNAAEA